MGAFREACETHNEGLLRELIAAHGAPACDGTIPLIEMSARAPWDRAIIAGTKTVEGRVASWRRRGKWVDNKKVVALNSPNTWFQ